MRWQGQRASNNVVDRRGRGGGGLPVRGGIGIGTLLLVLVAGYFGLDLTPLLNGGGAPVAQEESGAAYRGTPQEEEMAKFTAVALGLTEDTWGEVFRQNGRQYTAPKLVLYSGTTSTTCGFGQAAMGPFYCPGDQTVYIDLSFYNDMKKKLGGGGDFAQGYVIAHEVGHHVQHLLGIDTQVRGRQQGASQAQANALSVKMELQADCLAGVWGHYMENRDILEPGDLETALSTAEAIGDDRLQRQARGTVVPESFTHGTSQQRYQWLRRGYDSGNPDVCDTFSAPTQSRQW